MSPRTMVVGAAAALALAACDSTSSTTTPTAPGATPTATPDPFSGAITVLAASSLTSAFNTAETGLESTNPGFKATYSFAGSQTLVTEIINGAPADVIATADTSTMAQLTAKNLVQKPVTFCQNKLEIAVAPGNPLGITSLVDLNKPGVKLVIADPSVPVGAYVADIETSNNITFKPVSLQLSVAAVIEQLESGDANAALVFVTDVMGAGSKVSGVQIPDAQNKIGTYQIAAVSASGNLAAAEAFVTAAVSGPIQTALITAGFLPPPAS
ncbi:MAG TPA: molybdate ABC transporter substrate-binding protein [Candidatus Saccharimonadales bacterium]|nr:molybdate ABC transporter substrate-binding protein [Candidatus Saccharimonadales bacterium]